MTETLYINREWTEGYEAYTREFTLEELKTLQDMLDLEGLNCDSYADKSCDIMKYNYEGDIEECYNTSMEDEEFLTCYTVFRLWNTHLTQEEAKKEWENSCITTLEGIVEDMDA